MIDRQRDAAAAAAGRDAANRAAAERNARQRDADRGRDLTNNNNRLDRNPEVRPTPRDPFVDRNIDRGNSPDRPVIRDRGNNNSDERGIDRDFNKPNLSRPALTKPSLSKPSSALIERDHTIRPRDNDTISAIGKPGVSQSDKPRDHNNDNVADRGNDLGGARRGEFLVKPSRDNAKPRGNDSDVIRQFTPGTLQPRDRQNNGKGVNALGQPRVRDPEVVSGLRNRDVRDRDAVNRQRVIIPAHNNVVRVVDRRVIVDRTVIVRPWTRTFCVGRPTFFFGNSFCHRDWGWCGLSGFSFNFGWWSSHWGINVGFNNWDGCGFWRPRNWWGGPAFCRPVYWYPRYAYGCYFPRYACYSSFYYPSYGSYWWLYDNSSYSYNSGYNAGYANGYDTAMDRYGSYEPTWMAGGSDYSSSDYSGGDSGYGSVFGGGSAPERYSDRQAAPAHDGWDLLSAGDIREARRAFDRETSANAGDGLPEIGYAIAAGLMDRYDEAVASMRKALREDPDACREVPHDAKIANQITVLLTHYRNEIREKGENVDALFMTAALRHLLGEDALAYFAVDKAINFAGGAGDKDDSARVLKTLIQRSLDAQPDVAPDAQGPAIAPPTTSIPAPSSSPSSAPKSDWQF